MYCEACKKDFEEGIIYCAECGKRLIDKQNIDIDNNTDESKSIPNDTKEEPEKNNEVEADIKDDEKPAKNKDNAQQTLTFVQDESLSDDTVLIGKEFLKEQLSKPLSFWFYFILPFLMIIPVLNIVLIFTWAFGRYVNVNQRRIAFSLITWIIVIIITGILFGEEIFYFLSDLYGTVTG